MENDKNYDNGNDKNYKNGKWKIMMENDDNIKKTDKRTNIWKMIKMVKYMHKNRIKQTHEKGKC